MKRYFIYLAYNGKNYCGWQVQLNTLCIELNMPVSQLSPLLFELEMKGIVRCMPGGMYRLL